MSEVCQNQRKKWCSSVLGARQALLRRNANFLEPLQHPNLSLIFGDRVSLIESTLFSKSKYGLGHLLFDDKENTDLLAPS